MDTRKIKILAIDDDNGILTTIKSIFTDYDITTEINSFLALERVRKEKFDIILADFQMPHMDGIQLLKQVKQIYSNNDYIAVLCTGSGTTHLFREEYANDLFFCFIEKPFEVKNTRAVIEKAITQLEQKRCCIKN